MQRNNFKRQQRGVVIVIALFVVALVATMAYIMMERLQRDTSRTALIIRNTQAMLYAQGSVAWAMDTLRNDWEKQQAGRVIDHVPIASPVNVVAGYQISSTIEDMQARFNINNVSTPAGQADFLRMLRAAVPSLKEEQAYEVLQGTVDWVNPAGGDNVFTKYYRELPHPYRAAHRPMISPSEWQLVKGVTPAIFAAMQPWLTALPESTLINVQTAPAPVLLTLGQTLTLASATAIATTCANNMPATKEAFLALDVVKNNQLDAAKVTVSSSYFLVKTTVSIEKQQLVLYTLLKREANQGKARVSILWQSIGAW